MIRFLASVRSAEEALLAVDGGADIIDFKNPDQGALGALGVDDIARGIEAVAGRRPTSATVGDWPLDPDCLVRAAELIAATSVDYVKIGLLPGAGLGACVEALGSLARRQALIAVFFADRGVPAGVHAQLRANGFRGVLVDTFGKRSGGLRTHWSDHDIAAFVGAAREQDLLVGLAGSLRAADIPPLALHRPDILGFRGALCDAHDRTGGLSAHAMSEIRQSLSRALTTLPSPESRVVHSSPAA